jgi:DNA adenine methylase
VTATAPPFTYAGGKTTLASCIVALLPAHKSYVECFAGGLAVLLAKRPVKFETINDLDGAVVTFWRVLRERPEEFMRLCALTPHSRAELAIANDLDPGIDELELARRVWVRLAQGRAGTLRPTGWRHYQDPNGTTVAMPGYLAGYVARMPAAATRLANVSLECRPALDVIARYGGHPDNLIYADPPYLRGTRSIGRYRYEMAEHAQHRELAEALRSCRAAVVLSGYASPLYDAELYSDWCRVELPTWTGQGGAKRGRTEVLWSNRALAAQAELFANDDETPDPGEDSHAVGTG